MVMQTGQLILFCYTFADGVINKHTSIDIYLEINPNI